MGNDKWIKVSDRLPEYPGKYLGATGGKYPEIVECYEGFLTDKKIEIGLKFQQYVTHWMELPNLPEDE